jgi:hypothetical protein
MQAGWAGKQAAVFTNIRELSKFDDYSQGRSMLFSNQLQFTQQVPCGLSVARRIKHRMYNAFMDFQGDAYDNPV